MGQFQSSDGYNMIIIDWFWGFESKFVHMSTFRDELIAGVK